METQYTPQKPFITHLAYDDGNPVDYVPLDLSEEARHGARFQLPAEVPSTPAAISEIFLPEHLIQTMVECTNSYARARLPPGKLRAWQCTTTWAL